MIVAFIVSLFAVAGFGFGIWALNIVSLSKGLGEEAMQGISAMLDSELSDEVKEVRVRRAGITLLKGAWRLFWRFGAALAVAALPIMVGDVVGLTTADAVFSLMLRLDYIVGVSLAAILVGRFFLRRKGRVESDANAPGPYSSADRFAHMLAFSGPKFHKVSAKVDDYAFRRRVPETETRPPIFVTSLARGGTTSVLNALSHVEGMATHRYRDMPFIAAPYLWNGLGGALRRDVAQVERAHGDGLTIGLDSPEAFDEIFWHLFWPEKYRDDRIGLWHATDLHSEAQSFFDTHFRKICHLRTSRSGDGTTAPPRYLSKNNANIARLRLLHHLFPGSAVVVPIRHPGAHAWSMLRQHRNFLVRQAEDPFVLRYMRDIGHFEFGLLHRPLDFPELAVEGYGLEDPNYWLAYWIAAFRDVAAQGDRCHFVVQDDLRARPNEVLSDLGERLDIDVADMDFRGFFRAEPDARRQDGFSDTLLKQAEDIFQDLAAQAVTGRPRPARSPVQRAN